VKDITIAIVLYENVGVVPAWKWNSNNNKRVFHFVCT